ncbi:stress-induced-phosphoprotein [Anaeramoeba flamelloides]|uniref:Stress-induced-phosphoprotein n=1 Tax=Anaeramoeba flamelloides TaxID=1746091 RepID=A0ABQ8YJJ9_9EUKA|nr:stress-induced-phosphoprotein [Anaeramoeba flamelloides]
MLPQQKVNPYLVLKTADQIFRTSVVPETNEPKWFNRFDLSIKDPLSYVIFKVNSYEPNNNSDQLSFGSVYLNLPDLYFNRTQEIANFFYYPITWFPIIKSESKNEPTSKKKNNQPQLLIELFYEIPGTWNCIYQGYNNYLDGDYYLSIQNMNKSILKCNLNQNTHIVLTFIRCLSYFLVEKFELSLQDSINIEEIFPKDPESYYRTSVIYLLLEDLQNSRKSLQNALLYISGLNKINFEDFTQKIEELMDQLVKAEKKKIELDFVELQKKYFEEFSKTSIIYSIQKLLYSSNNENEDREKLFNKNNPPNIIVHGSSGGGSGRKSDGDGDGNGNNESKRLDFKQELVNCYLKRVQEEEERKEEEEELQKKNETFQKKDRNETLDVEQKNIPKTSKIAHNNQINYRNQNHNNNEFTNEQKKNRNIVIDDSSWKGYFNSPIPMPNSSSSSSSYNPLLQFANLKKPQSKVKNKFNELNFEELNEMLY